MKYEKLKLDGVDVAVQNLTTNWAATFILGESQVTVCAPNREKTIEAARSIIEKWKA